MPPLTPRLRTSFPSPPLLRAAKGGAGVLLVLLAACRASDPPATISASPSAPAAASGPAAASAPAASSAPAAGPPTPETAGHSSRRASLTAGLVPLPATAPEPVRQACEAARDRAQAELAKLPPAPERVPGEAPGLGPVGPGAEEASLLGRCFEAGQGAWVLEIEVLPPRARGTHRLWATFVTSEGKTVRSATPVPASGAAPPSQTIGLSQVGPLLDWDEDGSPDLLLSLRGMDYTWPIGDEVWRGVAYARRGGRVDAIAVPAFTSRPRLDPDGDGRADFLLEKRVSSTRCAEPGMTSSDRHFSLALPLLAHNTGKGVFRVDDEVGRRWAREHGCPDAPADGPLLDDDSEVSMRRILCARVMGAPSAALIARVRREHGQLRRGRQTGVNPRCAPLDDLLRAAAWRPDEVLTARP